MKNKTTDLTVSRQNNISQVKTTELYKKVFPANDMQFTEISTGITINHSLNAITLQNTAKKYTRNEILMLLTKVVKWGLQFFHVSQTMNEVQIVAFVNDFYNKYYTDTLEDLIMLFTFARQNQYGKTYKMIDSTVLFDWYLQYLDKKLDEKELQITKEKKKKIAEERKEPVIPIPPEQLQKLKKTLSETKEKEMEQKGTIGSRLRERLGTDGR